MQSIYTLASNASTEVTRLLPRSAMLTTNNTGVVQLDRLTSLTAYSVITSYTQSTKLTYLLP